jgi:fluoroacetyl-CoA thioesterase
MSDEAPRELVPGHSGTAELVVSEKDTARVMGQDAGDDFPAVFATARMIGLMEIAAARAMRGLLQPGQLSVGVSVDVEHLAPTPVGASVRATARYLGRDGKLYRFEVVAEDGGGEIGRGTHRRAIVATDRLLAGAARRKPGP